MPELKFRTVVVEGQSFEVPTNVYWKPSRQCWQVSVRLDKKNLTDNFHPEQYGDSIREAFDAACRWAVIKRQYPSRDRHVRGFRLSHRCLDGRPPLPIGIGYMVKPVSQHRPDHLMYKMNVYHEGKVAKTVTIGPVDDYTDEQYARALRICERHLKKLRVLRAQHLKVLDHTRLEHMSHAQTNNPLSQMLYCLGKHHASSSAPDA